MEQSSQKQQQHQQTQELKIIGAKKTLPIKYNYFKFPHSKRQIKSRFSNLASLKQWYQQMVNVWKRKKRKIWKAQVKGTSFIIKCIYSGCYSTIKYDQQQITKCYQLKIIKLYHRHQTRKEEKAKQNMIQNIVQAKQIIQEKVMFQEETSLKKQQPKQIQKPIQNQPQTVKSPDNRQLFNQFLIIHRLNFKFHISSHDSSQQYLIFFYSMRQNFQKYGDYIKISKSISNQSNHAIIVSGTNQQNKLLLFCVILLKQLKPQNIKQMLHYFLKHKQQNLRTIIVEDDANVRCAVNLLLRQGLFEGYCFFQENQFIKSKKCQEYKTIEVKQKILITNNLENFPSAFVGLNFLKPIDLKPYFSNLNFQDRYKLIHSIFKINDSVNRQNASYEICTYKFEDAFLDERLKNIRENLYPSIFNFFLEIYSYAYFYCKIQKFNKLDKKYYIKDQLIDKIFQIKQYVCQCNFVLKTGIPCHHLICYLQKQQNDCYYIDFMDSRWMIDKLSKYRLVD